jgi:predicted transcriptional regulator
MPAGVIPGAPPTPVMARIIELLREGPRNRAAIANALRLRQSVAGAVLTAMEFRQIVLKEGDRYSLHPAVTAAPPRRPP